jgi:coenzyme F420-0:L-glutamate ligase/coenzyme F420-1:gamma-L-glutamate ligase
MSPATLSAFRLTGIPLVEPGCDLVQIIVDALRNNGVQPEDGDIIAIAQKIVSKAEGRLVQLATVNPSEAAIRLAKETDKDPRVVELILSESKRVVRHRPGVIITEHRSGIILANAGIDRSNVAGDEQTVLLLPRDADASARRYKNELETRLGHTLGLIITDSVGRPWRLGTTAIAIGCAGLPVLEDLRGNADLFGRTMEVSEVATGDALASTAGLLMGEGSESAPVILIRGITARPCEQNAQTMIRPRDEDLFQ